jgi:hypothetical protein
MAIQIWEIQNRYLNKKLLGLEFRCFYACRRHADSSTIMLSIDTANVTHKKNTVLEHSTRILVFNFQETNNNFPTINVIPRLENV